MHFFVISALWGSKFRLICPLSSYFILHLCAHFTKERPHPRVRLPMPEDTNGRIHKQKRTSPTMRTTML